MHIVSRCFDPASDSESIAAHPRPNLSYNVLTHSKPLGSVLDGGQTLIGQTCTQRFINVQ